MTREKIVALLAATACVLGIVFTADSVMQASRVTEWMKRKYADFDRLRTLQRYQARDLASIAAFSQLTNKTSIPLTTLMKTVLPGSQPVIRPRETRLAAAGWSVRSAEISLDRVKLADLARFLRRSEEVRPPWRLVEFNVTALDQSPGVGRVSLVLEALEQTGSPP